MDNTFLALLLASSLAALMTTVGILAASGSARWLRHRSGLLVAFASGALTGLAILGLIPEALTMNPSAPYWVLGGFFVFHLLDRVVSAVESPDVAAGIVPVLGIGLHSLLDGVIMTVTFNVSILTGALAAVGMVAHELPEGVITFAFLEAAGVGRRRAVLWAFLAAAISTPIGTVVSFPLIQGIGEATLGALLALAGGALTYVGASHLLPRTADDHPVQNLLAVAAGVAIAVVGSLLGE